jgi:crotonobetaine/carnitine-CoA ligase
LSAGGPEPERTIPTHLRRAVEDTPDKTWLLADGVEYTYAQALDRVERAAGALRSLGLGAGDRVLMTSRTTPDYLLAWFALMDVGAVQVPLNPRSTPDELAGFVQQVEPALIVTDEQLAPGFGRPTVDVAELFDATPDGQGPADVDPGDVAVMIPTSGTTGRSKLVMQTHRAYVMAGEGFPWWLGLTADDRLMTSLPLFHINAPAYSTLGSIAARASLVLLPSFSASTFLDSARRFGATEFNAIGAMVEILMRQPARADDTEHAVRLCYTGPSPERERHLEIEARFGLEVTCGYALSETPYGLVWPRGRPHDERPYGTLGVPRQHPDLGHVNDARVVDGELQLRNPAIMRGYYEMPDETAEVLVDGWLKTGDLVTENGDGTFTYLGRKKQVIRRRGENLSPLEVEAVLERHPDVAEAAVIGVPSELSEDDVKAFVTATPGRTVVVAELHAFVRDHLARYKVPRYLEVVAELPHTPTGRLAKHRLPTERTAGEVDMEHAPATSAGTGDRAPRPDWARTWIGSTAPDRITVAGHDLPSELMGHVTLTEMAYLLVTRRRATPEQVRLVDAVLVALAEHGLTPGALSARLTYTGAPEAAQAAVAAGLLGAGSVFLGPTGDTAQFLSDALADALAGETLDDEALGDENLLDIAAAAVERRRAAGLRIPGLGHPLHRDVDPRVPRLYELARELGLLGPHLRLLQAVARVHEEVTGRHLPVNGAGAGGAALVDAGIPPGSVRGFVLIGRTAGLVGHLAEEAAHPLGMPLWSEVERRASEADG